MWASFGRDHRGEYRPAFAEHVVAVLVHSPACAVCLARGSPRSGGWGVGAPARGVVVPDRCDRLGGRHNQRVGCHERRTVHLVPQSRRDDQDRVGGARDRAPVLARGRL
eukprot:Amastigsp_a1451_35.p5 type:complete len:109 gc:universal Amastigsp_a1451_35:524-198(-)